VQAFSEVASVEEWQVTERESSLATFLLHLDFRDQYERTGGLLSLGLDRPDLPLTGRAWYRLEDHESVRPQRPWTLLENSDPWRAEPVIAEGRLHSVGVDWRYDTRNNPDDPAYGWFFQGRVEQGIGGQLRLTGGDGVGRATAKTGFNTAHLDLRRYSRISPYSLLHFRVVAAGSINGKGLPPQRQHALGGEGTLPAFGLHSFDCGARNRPADETGGAYPYYGCDRLALVQLEYQASFPLARRLGDRIGLGANFTNSVRWVAFFDAGRAWTEPSARDGRGGGNDDFSADAGIGIRVAGLGAYWAVPLSGGDRPINFFVRLGPRL
jgi:outer membrane protein assembly factor BamA